MDIPPKFYVDRFNGSSRKRNKESSEVLRRNYASIRFDDRYVSQRELARLLDKPRGFVQNRLRVLRSEGKRSFTPADFADSP